MTNEKPSALNGSKHREGRPTARGKWSKQDQFGDGQQSRSVSVQVSAVGNVKRILLHHNNWGGKKKTGQCSGGAAVQACSGSCFVKHNFLVHDWIIFFQAEEKRIWYVFLRIYLMTARLLNFSQKSSHKYLILIAISASLFPRAWFIDKILCTSLQIKQRLRIWKRQSYWVLL